MLSTTTDGSATDFDEFKVPFSSTVNNVIGCCMTFIAVMSILGNIAVWTLLLVKRSALSPIDFLTLNLALSDFLLASLCWPLAIAAAFRQRWTFGQSGCTFYGFMSYLFILSSVCSITALAVLRYLKLCRPRTGERSLYKIALRSIVCIWIYAFVTAMLPILGWNRYVLEPYRISCAPDWVSNSVSGLAFSMFATVQCLLIPGVISVFCYTAIFSKLYSKKGGARSRTRLKMQRRLVQSTVAVTVCFAALWTPYALVSLWNAFHGEHSVPLWVSSIPVVLAKSSSMFNPTIYLIGNKTFRHDTKEIVRCCGCRCCCVAVNENPTNWMRIVNRKHFVLRGVPQYGVKTLSFSTSDQYTSPKLEYIVPGAHSSPRSPCLGRNDFVFGLRPQINSNEFANEHVDDECEVKYESHHDHHFGANGQNKSQETMHAPLATISEVFELSSIK